MKRVSPQSSQLDQQLPDQIQHLCFTICGFNTQKNQVETLAKLITLSHLLKHKKTRSQLFNIRWGTFGLYQFQKVRFVCSEVWRQQCHAHHGHSGICGLKWASTLLNALHSKCSTVHIYAYSILLICSTVAEAALFNLVWIHSLVIIIVN